MLIAFLASCKQNPEAPSSSTGSYLNESNYRAVILKLTGYNVVRITHESGEYVRSSIVTRISVGLKDSTSFRELSSVPCEYDSSTLTYRARFDFTVALDSTRIQAPLTIRYYTRGSTPVDVDTTVDLITYPCKTDCVILDNSQLPSYLTFQDAARYGSKLFFHPYGPEGLYVFDLDNKTLADLLDYGGGDHIAADSTAVYCDIGHDHIYRYNLSTGLVSDTPISIYPQEIAGLSIFNNYLFVLVRQQSGELTLNKYTLGGTPIDSLPFSRSVYFMTICDSIVYSIDSNDPSADQISCFDLRTKSFLPNLLSPARFSGGIKVFSDTLYYCDYWKNYIGAVALSDLIRASWPRRDQSRPGRRVAPACQREIVHGAGDLLRSEFARGKN